MNNAKVLGRLLSTELLNTPEKLIGFTDEPKIPAYFSTPDERCKEKYKIAVNETTGLGYDLVPEKAMVKAAAESLERLCIYLPNPKLLSGRENYLENKKCIDPASFISYSKKQVLNFKEYVNKIRESKYRFVKSWDVLGKKEVLIPAQLIFLSHFKKESQIRKETTTSGAATGMRKNDAVLRGLLELIERDACMHAYLGKVRMKKIIDLPAPLSNLKRYFGRYLLKSCIFQVPNDFDIPITITITLDASGIGPALMAGSSANLTYEESIYHSMMESIQARGYARIKYRYLKERHSEIFNNELKVQNRVRTVEERALYWYPKNKTRFLGFWLKNNGIKHSIKYSLMQENVVQPSVLLSKIKERGFNIYLTDIGLPETKKQKIYVTKVSSPELLPLYLSEKSKNLYCKHYGELKDLTTNPHPFA